MDARACERGSALVEAAILFPVLVLLLFWAITLTDVLVLKLKAAEALRYALWETTVFKAPATIDAEVKARFADLRSPKAVELPGTALQLYPQSKQIALRAEVETTTSEVSLGGEARVPSAGGLGSFVGTVLQWLSRGVDEATRMQGFNVHGKARVRVALVASREDGDGSRILAGGDLPLDPGGEGFSLPKSLTRLTLMAPLAGERPMQLVFDTWKAWPKPAAYTQSGASTDVSVSPARTYPVVEEQVSSQVGQIAFFGLNQQAWFHTLTRVVDSFAQAGLTQAVMGGQLPDIFSTARMDGPERGPITILPPAPPDESWVPGTCEMGLRQQQCPSHRLGDVFGVGEQPRFVADTASLGGMVDRTRYTLPFRINTDYWRQSGGMDGPVRERRISPVPDDWKTKNEYVRTYECRGHFFAGSKKPQETDPDRRHDGSCLE